MTRLGLGVGLGRQKFSQRGSVPEPVFSLNASVGVSTSGFNVTAWADQSGSNDLDTVVGTPQLIPDALNGESYISFDSAYLRRATFSGLPSTSAARTMMATIRYRSNGWGGFAYGNSGTGQTSGLAISLDGDLAAQFWAQDLESTVKGQPQGWFVQTFTYDGEDVQLYLNDSVIISGARTLNTNGSGSIVVGAEIDLTPFVAMDVAEARVWDRPLTPLQVQARVSGLRSKYGI